MAVVTLPAAIGVAKTFKKDCIVVVLSAICVLPWANRGRNCMPLIMSDVPASERPHRLRSLDDGRVYVRVAPNFLGGAWDYFDEGG
jgi:hypothetical protein